MCVSCAHVDVVMHTCLGSAYTFAGIMAYVTACLPRCKIALSGMLCELSKECAAESLPQNTHIVM